MCPLLSTIKDKLYSLGAIYAQMSGSGSALYGIFNERPDQLEAHFCDCLTFIGQL